MRFTVEGNGKRSELRKYEDFHVGDGKNHVQQAIVRLPNMLTGRDDAYTCMQIHGGDMPLLRLSHVTSRGGYLDHLWASVKTGYPSEATSSDARSGTRYHVLMPHRETEFEVLLTRESGKIIVEIDGILIFNVDASDWKSTVNYFKEAHIFSGCPGPHS
jgi:hypothetical protein